MEDWEIALVVIGVLVVLGGIGVTLYFTVFATSDSDPEPVNPCQNGGAWDGSVCDCTAGGIPSFGEICEFTSCANGGILSTTVSGTECVCPPGFSGLRCETTD